MLTAFSIFTDSIGCFLDRTDRAMNALFASSFSMTVEWCKGYCRKNGHLYAALQVSNFHVLIGTLYHSKVIKCCLKR